MIIALSIMVVCILLFWVGEYFLGKRSSGANARISFKLFKRMHQLFPDKWILYSEYVNFYYEFINNENLDLPITREFRGYFGFFDLPKYWIYQSLYNRKLRKEREVKDYTEMLAAFNEMEKRIQK